MSFASSDDAGSAVGGDTLPAAARAVYSAIVGRRDVRAEFSGAVIDEETLRRILWAGHCAPSVGNSQPWDFVVIQDGHRLSEFAEHVAECRRRFADALPRERARVFDPITIEGIRESGTGVVVTYNPDRGGEHIIGRHTIEETGILSTALAIENMWLAATAEGLGMGWVSFYEESFLARFIGCTGRVRPVAWLCLGPVAERQSIPDLVRFGWNTRRPLADAIHRDTLHLTDG